MTATPCVPRPAKALILHLSGTGNTLRAARHAAQVLAGAGLRVRMSAIPGPVRPEPDEMLCLFSPTLGFSPPWEILKAAFGLPRADRTPALVVSTQGATPLGKKIMPGFCGIAPFLTALILRLNGYTVLDAFGLDTPANWNFVVSCPDAKFIESVFTRSLARLEKKIRDRLDRPAPMRWFSAQKLPLLAAGLLLLPATLGYLLFGRHFVGKMFFASTHCTGCGLCAKLCPARAITMRRGRPFWKLGCNGCQRCFAFCPEKAVEIHHVWGIALTALSLLPFFFPAPLLPGHPHSAANRILSVLLVFAALAAGSGLFQRATAVPALNRLAQRFSFGRLLGRYREPSSGARDFSGTD